ncbi:MAG: NAD-dependent epimerase/dehydratase family protein [Synechococcaceae cyanobacterium]|nr:NAD-dependent epimerase/dehydratase family protein [Synechococcaceae cyanobacterium]
MSSLSGPAPAPAGEPPALELSGDAPLLLTGASGWFGRTALAVLERRLGPEALRQHLIAYASSAREVDFGSPLGPLLVRPLEEIVEAPRPAGLLHLAFLTRDRLAEVGLETYVRSNRSITARVAALLRRWPGCPVVTTSSGAAASLDGRAADLEGNPYATLKQEEESLLRELAGADRLAVVLRVYAASGRFMAGPQRFALGDFLLQAGRGQTPRLQARRPVWRSYGAVGDIMELAWSLLLDRQRHGMLQLDACSHSLSLLELAQRIAGRFGLPPAHQSLDPDLPEDRYGADAGPFLEELRRYGLQPESLEQQIETTWQGLLEADPSLRNPARGPQLGSC